ncbi:hypothetical protein ACTSEZ_18285 [Metabacillus sp. JX24]|uniref:hypothetical protein n=1 Tax=Metabacillus sp. JX24 TaxID=3240759 RepID=UPI00350F01C6
MKDSVHHQAHAYLSFKKKQAEERRIQELQKQLEQPTLSLDEYLKIAESIGDEHLTSDQKEIVRLINVKKQHGERIKGVSAGLWNFTKDTASGLWGVLMTPPEQVLWDMGKAVINYEETYAQISAAIASSYERDMVNGDDYTRARWVTYAIATTATSFVGLKGADKTAKVGFAAGKNAVRETKAVVSNKIHSVNTYSFFPNRYAYIDGYDGAPYNVVDSSELKNTLITRAAAYSFKDEQGNTKTINLRMGHLKNDVHPITKVPYDKDGFPMFEA